MVKGASSLALHFSLRPVIVGLTVVAFATSAPEFLVSLIAAVKGSGGVSLGNILGSNVANIGLVLGISAMFSPLSIGRRFLRREVPFMIIASGVFWLVCIDGRVGRIDGAILLSGLGLFLLLGILTAKDRQEVKDTIPLSSGNKIGSKVVLLLLGLAGLVAGAHLTVSSAIFVARELGLSEVFIGLSIVAVGSSLPELATSVVAGARREYDISVGNVVGSNIFNICFVIGTVGLFNPVAIGKGALHFEFPAMFLVSILVFVFCKTGLGLSRLEGAFFLLSYVSFVYISYLLGSQ